MTPSDFAAVFDLPGLWVQARALMADLLARFGAPEDLAEQRRMRRNDQAAIRTWLTPVEMIARGLVAVAAATRLLMTPDGQSLLRTTPKIVPPVAPRPFPKSHKITTLTPGWFIIAQHLKPRPDPQPEPEPAPGRPAQLNGQFRGFRWRFPGHVPKTPLPLAFRTLLVSLDPPPSMRIAHAGGLKTGEAPDVIPLARRLAAIARVLARPEPAIRRFMRVLAKTPAQVLEPENFHLWCASREPFFAVYVHLCNLFRIFESSA